MKENLKREIGTFGLAAAVVNMMVGTGIFVLPALVAEHMGASAIICFFICGALIFLVALCFAEVGSKVNVSGGTYAYIEEAFGPFAGFLANNLFWFGSCVLGDGAVANALAKTLGFFIPAIDTAAGRPIFFLFIFGGLAWINIRGSKYGVRFIVISTFAKLIPLLLIIGFGTGHITAANLVWKHMPTLHNIGISSLVLFYAFLGIETAVTNGGEFRNPRRTVPLGILTGLSFVLLLYIAIQLITQGILGDQLIAHKEAPIAAVANILFGKLGTTLVVLGTAFSILGALSGEVLAVPRVLFAGGRDGILPKCLSKVHPKYITPHISIALYSAMVFFFATFGVFKQLIILSSAATLMIYLGVVLSTIKLRYKRNVSAERTFTIPGGITVPLIATIVIIWLLSSLSKEELIGVSLFMGALMFIYLVMYLVRKKKILPGA